MVQREEAAPHALQHGVPLLMHEMQLLAKVLGVAVSRKGKKADVAMALLTHLFPEMPQPERRKLLEGLVAGKAQAPADPLLLQVCEALEEADREVFRDLKRDVESRLLQVPEGSTDPDMRKGRARGPTVHNTPGAIRAATSEPGGRTFASRASTAIQSDCSIVASLGD